MLEIFTVPTLAATSVLAISLLVWWIIIDRIFRPGKTIADKNASARKNTKINPQDTQTTTSATTTSDEKDSTISLRETNSAPAKSSAPTPTNQRFYQKIGMQPKQEPSKNTTTAPQETNKPDTKKSSSSADTNSNEVTGRTKSKLKTHNSEQQKAGTSESEESKSQAGQLNKQLLTNSVNKQIHKNKNKNTRQSFAKHPDKKGNTACSENDGQLGNPPVTTELKPIQASDKSTQQPAVLASSNNQANNQTQKPNTTPASAVKDHSESTPQPVSLHKAGASVQPDQQKIPTTSNAAVIIGDRKPTITAADSKQSTTAHSNQIDTGTKNAVQQTATPATSNNNQLKANTTKSTDTRKAKSFTVKSAAQSSTESAAETASSTQSHQQASAQSGKKAHSAASPVKGPKSNTHKAKYQTAAKAQSPSVRSEASLQIQHPAAKAGATSAKHSTEIAKHGKDIRKEAEGTEPAASMSSKSDNSIPVSDHVPAASQSVSTARSPAKARIAHLSAVPTSKNEIQSSAQQADKLTGVSPIEKAMGRQPDAIEYKTNEDKTTQDKPNTTPEHPRVNVEHSDLRAKLVASERKIASLQSTLSNLQNSSSITPATSTGGSTSKKSRPTLLSKVRVLDPTDA